MEVPRKYALSSESLEGIDTPTLELLRELHDLRDTKTALLKREEEIRDKLIENWEVPVNSIGKGSLDLKVCRINSRLGNRYVDMDKLIADLGEGAYEYIYRRSPVITITHIDPASIEIELGRRTG